ncbi:unnamed protein product [Gadus morhua 'NCC']
MEHCEQNGDPQMENEQCSRLVEERDEAERQLKHIKRVSQMVIEEVNVLQTQLEIEKSCRENAEALATKLNSENRKLKYLSLSSRTSLDEMLPSVTLEEVSDTSDTSPDSFTHYQQQVKELRETVNTLLEDKKESVCQIHNQQRQIEELTAQLERGQAEMKELRETIEQQSKTIKRFNRVSMMATQEYGGLRDQLDLEQSLRVEAETFAHEMLVKQKEANRQSVILMQNAEPSMQLLKALEDIATVTKTLEDERLQHQQKVQALEAELQQSALQGELESLRRQVDLLDEERKDVEVRLEQEKKEVQGRLEHAEKRSQELEERVLELQEAQKTDGSSSATVATGDGAPPPPPGVAPPPAPPPPTPSSPSTAPAPSPTPSPLPLQPPQGSQKAEETPAVAGGEDVKSKAVNEMMERIKHGVVLRPVKSKDSKQPLVSEESALGAKPQESAMEELMGILETVKRSPSRGSQEQAAAPAPPAPAPPPLGKKDSELEVILRRRRNRAGEPGGEKEGQMVHVSSSDSLNGRRTSSDSSGKEPDSAGGLGAPADPAGSRVSPDGRGSGPGPVVPRRKSSDTGKEPRGASWQERRSCTSLPENEAPESPVSNGCTVSGGEDDEKSNGGDHNGSSNSTHLATPPCAPANGSPEAEC